jgi:hypothetical protein
VFGGDALVVREADGGQSAYEVQIAAMPSIAFAFDVERRQLAPGVYIECLCKITLDALTIAAGEMSESRQAITWDTILNNDVWERQASRRLENYEVENSADMRMLHKIFFDKVQKAINRRLNFDGDDNDLVDEHQRRLQQQDVRMDFEVQTAGLGDSETLQVMFDQMTLGQIEEALRTALAETDFTIGSVYMKGDVETQTIVTPGRTTSWAARSAGFWTWLPLLAIVAALLSV